MKDQSQPEDAIDMFNRLSINFVKRMKRLETDPKAFIDPVNPYTGEVSVLTIFHNMKNGHTTFPGGMGKTKKD